MLSHVNSLRGSCRVCATPRKRFIHAAQALTVQIFQSSLRHSGYHRVLPGTADMMVSLPGLVSSAVRVEPSVSRHCRSAFLVVWGGGVEVRPTLIPGVQ